MGEVFISSQSCKMYKNAIQFTTFIFPKAVQWARLKSFSAQIWYPSFMFDTPAL